MFRKLNCRGRQDDRWMKEPLQGYVRRIFDFRSVCSGKCFRLYERKRAVYNVRQPFCIVSRMDQIPSLVRISCGMAFLFTITDRVLYSTNGREK